jgi:hypothetical protein
VLRSYSFIGANDTAGGVRDWPNVIEREAGRWTYAHTLVGPMDLTTRRFPAGANRHLLRISGELGPAAGGRDVYVGLAADPDIGEPSNDVIGFDASLGLAWVGDTTEGRFVGYLSLDAGASALLRQFSTTERQEPASSEMAYAVMTGPSQFAPDRPDDIRFLLTAPGIAVDGRGHFQTTFAVFHANSLRDLRTLAESTRANAVALMVALPADEPGTQGGTGFALRQRVAGTALVADLAGAARGSSGGANISSLQSTGITALDYSVPDGRDVDVQIRLYNSSGQLVRTLLRQRVAGGQYHLEWDLLNERGQRVSPGVYVAVMEAGGHRITRKLVVTR